MKIRKFQLILMILLGTGLLDHCINLEARNLNPTAKVGVHVDHGAPLAVFMVVLVGFAILLLSMIQGHIETKPSWGFLSAGIACGAWVFGLTLTSPIIVVGLLMVVITLLRQIGDLPKAELERARVPCK